jgi:hypothetical protein
MTPELNHKQDPKLLTWTEFHKLWLQLLSRNCTQSIELADNTEWIIKEVGEEQIYDFSASLYCYHLIQQVYLEYFLKSSHGSPPQEIQISDKCRTPNQTGRLSPAAMPLAVLSRKKIEFHTVTAKEYEIWRTRGRLYDRLILNSGMRYLHREGHDYFPNDFRNVWLNVLHKAMQKHEEIDNLILTRRFKFYHNDCEDCGRIDCYCKEKSTLELGFRECEHTAHELAMFQKIRFEPEDDVDTISVTANLAGFTTIYAVCRSLKFDWELVRQVAECANKYRQVISISEFNPRLIVVPKTLSVDYPGSRRLMTQLIFEANKLRTKVLHMTHYGFCNGLSQPKELTIVLRDLNYPHLKTTIEKVIIDFDSRAKRDVTEVLKEVGDDLRPWFF